MNNLTSLTLLNNICFCKLVEGMVKSTFHFHPLHGGFMVGIIVGFSGHNDLP